MITDIILQAGLSTLVMEFEWCTATGQFMPPTEMATRHVFNTLRMIWNHSVPEEYKLRPYHKYCFNLYYTQYYMRVATLALILELTTRSNLTADMKRDLSLMNEHLKKMQEERVFLIGSRV